MLDRIVALEGVRNFRDFGGWDTPRGRLPRGHLWRSANFAEATPEDIDKIHALNIAAVCDLRRPEERKMQPNRWPHVPSVRVLESNDGGRDEPPHIAFLRSGDLSPTAVQKFMCDLYEEIPFDPRYVSLFRDFFVHLIEDGGSGLVHCAAGKDRTGILCALTLMALDVREDDVFADYEFTNVAVDLTGRMPEIQQRFEEQLGFSMPLESLRPFLGVDLAYLYAALASIRGRAGSVETYLDQTLGVDAAARAKLAERMAG
ncbi:MAG: protein-tyrosine-phosphatase [Alphaproteobacteria bacterium]|nr:protein-tyrosine-phosphatase [Alphaproteobacteria bacterium]